MRRACKSLTVEFKQTCLSARQNLAHGGSGRAVEEEEEEAQEEAAQILFSTRRSHLEIWTFFFA